MEAGQRVSGELIVLIVTCCDIANMLKFTEEAFGKVALY